MYEQCNYDHCRWCRCSAQMRKLTLDPHHLKFVENLRLANLISAKVFSSSLVPLISRQPRRRPFKLNLLVTHWLSSLVGLQLLAFPVLPFHVCERESFLGNRKMLFVWGRISDEKRRVGRAATSSRKGHLLLLRTHNASRFEISVIMLRYTIKNSSARPERGSIFSTASGRVSRQIRALVDSMWWMASHFIEFFASLILLLRCTSLLLNWIDSRSPLFSSSLLAASVVASPPHVCDAWQSRKYDNIFVVLAVRRGKQNLVSSFLLRRLNASRAERQKG